MSADSAESQRQLLLDHEARVEAVGDSGRFGKPGRRFDRSSPFWVGLLGGLGVAVAYVIGVSIASARQVLLLIALALFIAIGLEPIVALLNRHRVPRWLAVVIVSLGTLGLLAGFLAAAIPPLVNQINHLINEAPHYLQELNNKNSFLGNLNKHYHLVTHLKKSLTQGGVSSITSGVLGAGQIVISVAGGIVICVALTLYFLADMPRVTQTIYRLIPKSRRARGGLLIDELFARVGGYFLGNILTSVIAGVGTLIWLLIFGIPYALLLSVMVAFLDLIPIVGSTVGGLIVSLVALTVSLPIAIATAAFYIVYRNAEDYLITPKVMKRTVEIPGLATVIAVLIGGALLGIIGALLAIPIAAGIKLILDEVTFPRMDTD